MGRTHAASGAVGFAAAAPLLAHLGLPWGTLSLPVGVVAAAGAALLPDLDHPQATVSRALGPVTGLVVRAVHLVSGGHRQGTHSLVGVMVFVAAAVAAEQAGEVGRGLLLAGLLVLASAGSHVRLARPAIAHIAVCVAGGMVLVAAGTSVASWVVPVAVGVGVVAHLVGDALTAGGIPVLWPYPARLRLAGLRTGGIVEQLVVGPVLAVVAVGLCWRASGGPGPVGAASWSAASRLVGGLLG